MAYYTSEAEQIAATASRVTDDSLESTRRMLRTAEESKQTAASTMATLDHQGEQLRRVEDAADKIARDTTQAERNLKELTKWKLMWRFKRWLARQRGPSGGASGSAVEGGYGTIMASKQPPPSWGVPDDPRSGRLDLSSLSGPYVERITGDAREDEMEENLVAVGGVLGSLKAMAVEMGGEIDRQNERIGHIAGMVDVNKVRIEQVNHRADRLIR